MAGRKGVITRRDVISDKALNWGKQYVKNVQEAINANEQLIEAVIQLNEESKKLKTAGTQKAYIDAKNKERLATQKAIDAIKKQEAAELSALKIKRESIKTAEQERKAQEAKATAANKATAAKKAGVRLSLEEKIANQENARNAALHAKANGALSSTYATLNARRQVAARNLANLLAAEKQNVVQVRVAQREFERLDAKVKAVDAATKNYSKNIGNYRSAFKGFNNVIRQLVSSFGLLSGIALVGQTIRDIFTTIRDFDRQLIAVGKTTNITGESLQDLGRRVVDLGGELNGIQIQGLLNTAEVAGQLGVKGTRNILAFSEAVEKLKLTSDIVTREQVQNLAKFIEVSEDSFNNADKLASVITELGNNFATTEAQILSNATEIQKGVALYKTSAESVLGLGAATSALGAQAEASRSAVQLTFKAIDKAIASGDGLNKILELTTLTERELAKQFRKDASVVFERFIEGLVRAKDEGENLNLVLQEVGINQIRTTAVVGALASNYDVLKSALQQSRDEYVANIALNREVEAASKSIASIIGDVKDKWDEYILKTNEANDGTRRITTALVFLRDNLGSIIDNFLKYGSVLLTYVATMKIVTFLTTTYTALKGAAAAAELSFALATGIGTKATLAKAAALRAATAAQTGMNAAMAATPWGIILAAIAAVVVAIQVFNDELTESEILMRKIKKQMEAFEEAEEGYNDNSDKFRKQQFENLEKELELRRAKGEDAAKLDEEEIRRKKEIVQAEIDEYNRLKKQELERTKATVENSKERIAQLQLEKAQLGDGYSDGLREEEIDEELIKANEKLAINRKYLEENKRVTIQRVKELNEILLDLDFQGQVELAERKEEEDKKARAAWLRARKKMLREAFEARRKLEEDEFKLNEFRLEKEIRIGEEIVDAEESTLDERLDAQEYANDMLSQKLEDGLRYRLRRLGEYNEETGVFTRELSDQEIDGILATKEARENLTDEQLLLYEQFQEAMTQVALTEEQERKKIIDDEIDRIQKGVSADVQLIDNEANREVVKENTRYADELEAAKGNFALIEQARFAHEKRMFEIQRRFALQGINFQIGALEDLLAANDAKVKAEQISADKRAEIVAQLEQFRRQASDISTEQYLDNVANRALAEERFKQEVEELVLDLVDALKDFGNALFDADIQRIDERLDKREEYYEEQLRLAQDDAEQQELIRRDQEKDRKRLEAEKRKAQIKQAKFNKAFALADIAFNTTKAVMAIASTGGGTYYADFGISAGILTALTLALGAAQAATVLATPLPKYKHGREGGPAEMAITGDGYIKEVISGPDGQNPRLTDSRPTLTKLEKNERVHSSITEYKTFMREMTKQGIEVSGKEALVYSQNHSYESKYDKEFLEELKRNTRAVEKNKPNIVLKSESVDYGHKIWAAKNVRW
jgi:hypothetical protein